MELTKKHRLNHPTFGDVYGTIFKEGEILSLDTMPDKTFFQLVDTCTVKIEMENRRTDVFERVPFFYKCREGYYDKKVGTPREIKKGGPFTFYGATRAFRKGDRVCVLLYNNIPTYIMGHADAKPKMCVDLILIKCMSSEGNYFRQLPRKYLYLSMSGHKEYGFANRKIKDHNGFDLRCNQKATVVYYSRQFEKRQYRLFTRTRVHDRTIWFISLAPIAITIESYMIWDMDHGHIIGETDVWLDIALYYKGLEEEVKRRKYVPLDIFTNQIRLTQLLRDYTNRYGLLWDSTLTRIYGQDRTLWQ